jgi:hypothetical protein
MHIGQDFLVVDAKGIEVVRIPQNPLYEQPIAILHDKDLDDFQKWQYWPNK